MLWQDAGNGGGDREPNSERAIRRSVEAFRAEFHRADRCSEGRSSRERFDLHASGERRQKNDLINEIRYQVTLWRQRGYPHVTPISRKLLLHWAQTLLRPCIEIQNLSLLRMSPPPGNYHLKI